MSVILITEHSENIYNSTKKATTYHKKSPRYVSRHTGYIKHEIATNPNRKPYRTIGTPQHPLPDPKEYLRKGSGIRYVIPPDKNRPNLGRGPKPPVPKSADLFAEDKAKREKEAQEPDKNFVVKNIKNAINMKAKEPVPKVAINRYGVVKKLSAGMEPTFIYADTFGKMPEYLTRFIKKKEKTLQLKKDSTGTEQPKCRYITREERDDLLAGLKENWEELQKTYQGLPILTDTIPKVHRKSKLEAQLKQLEKDIVVLERHPYIYVYDDNELPK